MRYAVLVLVLCAAVVASVSLGDIAVPPMDVLQSLLFGGGEYDLVVRELRWPRTLLAAVGGAALAIGGALIQSVTRNPLASPDIIGITQGAGLAATIALTTGIVSVAPAATAGGLLAAAAVFAFGGAQTSRRFVLAGVAIAFALRAGIEIVLTSAETLDAQRAQIWLIGSLNGRGFEEAAPIGVVLALTMAPLAWAAWALRTTSLDDDVARGIGVRPVARRYGLAALGVVIAATATAQIGAVDFVALVAPQLAQRLSKRERPPIVASALIGATLVVFADLLGRRLLAPTQLPAGVLTAALGAPYLVYLLLKRRRA
ncbi:FecCD family ABC transporter permease [Allorhizocola rhizosphaerae]|uniref:FecCD family ABC transporter permease n=1 Tax=Allorhizocola rhizosphaerae TaxID=1872709 RepID=UPI000E3EE2E5|nr:iron ABC transporter permease [Allorhizocola rhizosphaerae]